MHTSWPSMLRGPPMPRPHQNHPYYSLLQPTLTQYSIKEIKIVLRGYFFFIIIYSRIMLYLITASTLS